MAGAKLCAHVEQVLLLESDIIADLPGLADETAGPPLIRVAASADSVATWFPHAAARFTAETGEMLDLIMDDEAHTADPTPVAGC